MSMHTPKPRMICHQELLVLSRYIQPKMDRVDGIFFHLGAERESCVTNGKMP